MKKFIEIVIHYLFWVIVGLIMGYFYLPEHLKSLKDIPEFMREMGGGNLFNIFAVPGLLIASIRFAIFDFAKNYFNYNLTEDSSLQYLDCFSERILNACLDIAGVAIGVNIILNYYFFTTLGIKIGNELIIVFFIMSVITMLLLFVNLPIKILSNIASHMNWWRKPYYMRYLFYVSIFLMGPLLFRFFSIFPLIKTH